MQQLLPGHSSSFKPSVLPEHILFLLLKCGLWLWCETCLHEYGMRFLLGHEPFVFFFFFKLLFSVKRKGWSLTTLMINCGGFIAPRWVQGPLCSHKETCFDLKNEHFIIASVRLTDCCGFLIYWFSVSEFFWLCFINKELLEV